MRGLKQMGIRTVLLTGDNVCRCNRIIMTNFAGTLLVDTAGIGLAMFGFLNPILAALIHVTSELIFILNSARLLPALSRE